MEYIQQFFSWVWSAIKAALVAVLSVLPESPFRLISNTEIGEYLGYINWIIPLVLQLVDVSVIVVSV